MRMIYDGHEYSYSETVTPDTEGTLKDNYGTVVATLDEDIPEEYFFAIMADSSECVGLVHQNVIKDTAEARGQWLLGCYVAYST